MRIALDAMGTDRHPAAEVLGAVRALQDLPGDFEIVLVGDQPSIEAQLAGVQGEYPRDRLTIVHTTQCITPSEPAVTAVRRKQDSSIVVGLGLQKQGKADAFVSAGSTGAVMAASLFLLRPIPGVDRPTVSTILPTAFDPVLLVDSGSNVDSKPQNLLQFARLGAVYAQDVLNCESPRVGLLNIGEEPEKGNELTVAAHQLLRESDLRFVGNVEGRDIVKGVCDVLVTDGFAGNVLLKFYESVATFMYGMIARELKEAGATIDLDRIFQHFDYTEYGGAPLLGVNGTSIICHGGSPPRAIKNAVRAAIRCVETDLVGHIKGELAAHPEPAGTA
ncbi:MAG TPA: phosphate acyltransferase PlsX [Longimicrobiales bacterium]|nr:phosphate acyltransferase PlsX [Longimicrobiales bacterium]